MTHLLWKHYWEDDLDKFRALLAPASYATQGVARSPNLTAVGSSSSPGAFGTSPRAGHKSRKVSGAFGFGSGFGNAKHGGYATPGRAEINSRDHAGLTVLLRAASSTAENARAYVDALLEHPAIDIYVQDPESGWNALHRALYAGNISIARALLQKERQDLMGHTASVSRVGQLIKTKDHEGNSPFELYTSTIGERALKALEEYDNSEDEFAESDEDSITQDLNTPASERAGLQPLVDGEELFAFGSNKNLSLGLGDEDDRQFPERVYLKRPDHLIQRFYNEYLEEAEIEEQAGFDLAKVPTLVAHRPLLIHDVALSKLHSAVITADPVSNLYICGVGRGGRLGLGDENTRFHYTPVQGGLADKKVVQVALGQNHTMAVTDNGELWTWGSNAQCQLGYALPPPTKADETPMSTTPRQVFGPLKKERVLGITASSIHSVAHTGSSLYCWGKNVGQLALMDADSRSLEVQQTPRKVAPSIISGGVVAMVSAIDKATAVLLQNHSVYVLVAYGYVKLSFFDATPILALKQTPASFRYEAAQNRVQYIAAGGDGTIAAVTVRGDLFTANLDYKLETNPAATSTTNPSKIKGAVTQPQCIWSARKDGVRSVSVGENGSVIFSTQSGAVWQRIKRVKAKNTQIMGSAESKRKDFKFQRVPYITRVATVRASSFGAFAAIRKDSDVMKQQLRIKPQSLWEDVAPLNCLRGFKASDISNPEKDTLKFWDADTLKRQLGPVAYEILKSPDLDTEMQQHLAARAYSHEPLDCLVRTSSSPEIDIPVHGWLLSARSSVLRGALAQARKTGSHEHADTFTIEVPDDGRPALVTFQGIDLVSLLNVVLFMYEDKVIPTWNFTRQTPALAYRYRQIRTEVMRVATRLNMPNLESSARMQIEARTCMDRDFRDAIKDRSFFEDGDALLDLDGLEVPVHSTFVCQRCPWFQGLFHGRSRGQWLASRREAQAPSDKVRIDLKHMDPEAFKYVLEYIYGDFGAELFGGAVTEEFDDFVDLTMDVLGMADYLLLDRLSQICQQVLGRCVNTRNASSLLNAISPCSITEFRNAGLEYICLQVENQLENHLLDDLDEDLLAELDEVVRANQTAQFPFVRSGRAEHLLHDKYPELAEEIAEERHRRVKEMAFKATQKEEERKLSSSFKGRYGSLDDFTAAVPSPDRARRASRVGRNEPFSPDLRPKTSVADLMFEMDEDSSAVDSPLARPQRHLDASLTAELDQIPPLSGSWKDARGKSPSDVAFAQSPLASLPSAPSRHSPAIEKLSSEVVALTPVRAGGNPWGPANVAVPAFKISDLLSGSTDPMLPPSSGSSSPAVQKAKEASSRPAQPKLSQKERKKQQQVQAAQATELAAKLQQQQSKAAWEKSSDESQVAPWKLAGAAAAKSKTSLKDLLATESSSSTRPPASPVVAKPLVAAEVTPAQSVPRRTASPDTRFAGQSRTPGNVTPTSTTTTTTTTAARSRPARPPPPPTTSQQSGSGSGSGPPKAPLVPHSKLYITPAPKEEPSLGLSMADIMGQQRREQERVREAVAKRSLQEIQAEQEFQEWWEAESRRTQEEEARRLAREQKAAAGRDESGHHHGHGGSRRNGGGGGGGRKGGGGGSGGGSKQHGGANNGGVNNGGGGRGGRGGGGGSAAIGTGGRKEASGSTAAAAAAAATVPAGMAMTEASAGGATTTPRGRGGKGRMMMTRDEGR